MGESVRWSPDQHWHDPGEPHPEKFDGPLLEVQPPPRAEYRLVIPAPCKWLSLNRRLHWARHSDLAGTWRHAAYIHARAAKLPKDLERVRIDAVLRFPTRRKRDPSNYHATVKPLVDGLAAPQRYVERGKPVTLPGYGLIPDDCPEFLDGPHIEIGPVWPKPHSYGQVELLITDLSGEAS